MQRNRTTSRLPADALLLSGAALVAALSVAVLSGATSTAAGPTAPAWPDPLVTLAGPVCTTRPPSEP